MGVFMKKIIVLFFLLMGILHISAVNEKVMTEPEIGVRTIRESGETAIIEKEVKVSSREERLELLWETSDAAAICGGVKVSATSGNSFVRWQTNSERVSLFADTAIPLWEHTVGDLDFDYPIDMTENGEILAVGDQSDMKIFTPGSSEPFWTCNVGYYIAFLELNAEGTQAYLAYPTETNSVVQMYNIEDDEPVWTNTYDGGTGSLTLSEDGSTLIFTQYGGGFDNMFVLNAEDGNLIFEAPEYNQNPPAISNDGSVIVNGDYSGYIWVYEYSDELETYEELWHYHVNGGGTSHWIGGMAVSADGNTIAAGTLTFLSAGYNGQVYLFDKSLPEPIWVYDDAGDYVVSVDLSADGSVLAACGYGPYDGNGADFMLFRRSSNIPVFELDTPGSLFSVDLASDGSFCTTGGKAVHAREMGSGGNIYSIDCDLGGGDISGYVNLSDNEDNSGVYITLQGMEGYYTWSDSSGFYEITHIPAGLYTVDYTKTGYESYSCFDGIVMEDELTEIDEVTLNSFGASPVNLRASQAEGVFIELNWEAPAGEEPAGYFVYRKKYLTQEYPSEPLTIVFAEDGYTDETALAGIEYYYAVTAMTDSGEQSPYSNTACGWSSTGFIADYLSVYEGSTPMVDGEITPGEWNDAYCFDASDFWGSYDNTAQPVGSVIGYFKMNTDQTELYVAFENFNDTELEDHDEVALYIDDNGDGVYPEDGDDSEGNYWAAWYAAGVELKYRPIHNSGGVGDIVYLEDPAMAASAATGHVVYEFVLPIGEEYWQIDIGEENISNIGIFVLDDNDPDPHGFDAWWPYDNIDIFDPAGYGEIVFGDVMQIPDPPQNLTIEQIDNELLRLNWQPPATNTLTYYNIYFSDTGSNFTLISETEGSSYVYEFDPQIEQTLWFYVTSLNDLGESVESDIVEFNVTELNPQGIISGTFIDNIYPNPFNPVTKISFNIAEEKLTEITIFNIKGQKVRRLIDSVMPAGMHEIYWDGKNDKQQSVATGVYFIKMDCGSRHDSRRVLLLK